MLAKFFIIKPSYFFNKNVFFCFNNWNLKNNNIIPCYSAHLDTRADEISYTRAHRPYGVPVVSLQLDTTAASRPLNNLSYCADNPKPLFPSCILLCICIMCTKLSSLFDIFMLYCGHNLSPSLSSSKILLTYFTFYYSIQRVYRDFWTKFRCQPTFCKLVTAISHSKTSVERLARAFFFFIFGIKKYLTREIVRSMKEKKKLRSHGGAALAPNFQDIHTQ